MNTVKKTTIFDPDNFLCNRHKKICEQLILDEYGHNLDDSVIRKSRMTESHWSLVDECIEQFNLDVQEYIERAEWAYNIPDRYTKDIMDDSSWDGNAFDAMLKVADRFQTKGF